MIHDVLVIGAGFSGVCLGAHLLRAGVDRILILEKGETLGGTWRDNTYPGAACDVPAFSYCFSFEQKTDWSRKWAPQAEILAYMRHVADKYGVTPKIRTGVEVEEARFDPEQRAWRVRTTAGEELVARHLVSAVGQLSRPLVPDLPGLTSFTGLRFHSARWDPRFDPTGKSVAIVGNAASAVQIVPELAKVAKNLVIFQRSANWILRKYDRQYTALEKRLYSWFPFLAKVYRTLIWATFELRFPLFRENWVAVRFGRRLCERYLEEVQDLELRRRLTPDYLIGGKRILGSDDYYAALSRPNVQLVTSPIQEIVPDGIATEDGDRVAADAIVLATGFQTTQFLAPMRIVGEDGVDLETAWKDGAEAYLGINVAGFPNFHMMYGPNTNLGHNSILFMLECQSRYIVRLVTRAARLGFRSVDVRREVQRRYNEKLSAELALTAWARVEKSWYKDAKGRITNNWSRGTIAYWWRTRRTHLADYHCVS